MERLTLNGAWELQRADRSQPAVSANVPGDAVHDLLAAGQIPDPFWRDNELRMQWVGETDWSYCRSFDVPASLLRHERVLLRCAGLDTLAEIELNGRPVASADNMFRTWEFDVGALLKPAGNVLRILFRSPLSYMEKRQKSAPHRLSDLWFCAGDGLGWVRKEACNFGWDWGLKAVTCGIWRDIELLAFSGARLDDVRVRQDHQCAPHVALTVTARAETLSPGARRASVRVSRDGQVVAETRVAVRRGQLSADLTVENAELWWPNNLGAQALYDVAVELQDADGQSLDLWSRRIGLRTLRLDRHEDEWGESFRFVVNGVPFFAKGANWIPADAILARRTAADYRRLVADSAQANMNMLRVWGGGLYEDEAFYDACDEYGICVWQDFLFACATYPAYDRAFRENLEQEFTDNVRRLRHRACLALWCGNNEMEQINLAPRWGVNKMSWSDYKKIFDRLLPRVLRREDPDRDYWPSSPHTPQGDRTDYNNPHCGDAHLWNVWHRGEPFEWYRTCTHRFNSEFGFQSFPEPRTVAAFTEEADRNVTAPVMEHHQRSGIGNSVIVRTMLDWFRLPARFDMLLWLSQIQQGMAMKYAIEHWRRSMPRGMGTLYWQLNDCWPAASWSSIDYFGRWKALHHMARRFFAPLLISVLEDAQRGTAELHATNDLRTAVTARVSWRLMDLDGTVLESGQTRKRIPALANTRVRSLALAKALQQHGAENVLFLAELQDDAGRTLSDNLALWARPKRMNLRDPQWKIGIRKSGKRSFRVTLAVRRPALWAWLEVEDEEVRYTDNFFHVVPGRDIAVELDVARDLPIAELRRKLRVRSLIDTYAFSSSMKLRAVKAP
jgi:beta-mannosidase